MSSGKWLRGQPPYEWTPQRKKLLIKLWCVDRFHRIIVLNNLGCSHHELVRAIKRFKLKRKRAATKKSKSTSFKYTPKLSLEKAREIRELIAQNVPRREIADRYNVCVPTIRLVRKNRIWKEKEDA